MRLEGGGSRTGVVNTRRVLEEGSAAGREGGQLGSGWRQLGAGRGSWRLITAAALGLRKEQSPKTNRGHSGAASTASPPASPRRVLRHLGGRGLPARVFFLTEKQIPSIAECSWCEIGKPIHSHLSTSHPAQGTLRLRAETRHTAPAGVGCSRRVSPPLRRHHHQFASSPRGC